MYNVVVVAVVCRVLVASLCNREAVLWLIAWCGGVMVMAVVCIVWWWCIVW